MCKWMPYFLGNKNSMWVCLHQSSVDAAVMVRFLYSKFTAFPWAYAILTWLHNLCQGQELMDHGQGWGLRAQGWLFMNQLAWVKGTLQEVNQQKSGGKGQSSWAQAVLSRQWISSWGCKNIAICIWISWNCRNCITEWQALQGPDKMCILSPTKQQIQSWLVIS